MSETSKNPFDLLVDQIRVVVREELTAAAAASSRELLSVEELAAALKVPMSWVYEQSRLGNIPTHRVGKYIRFNFAEVLQSQKGLRDS